MSDITVADMPDFERAYLKAVDRDKESFFFKDNEVLTAYAGYVLEYYHNNYDLNDLIEQLKIKHNEKRK
jgi:hypothetical protein